MFHLELCYLHSRYTCISALQTLFPQPAHVSLAEGPRSAQREHNEWPWGPLLPLGKVAVKTPWINLSKALSLGSCFEVEVLALGPYLSSQGSVRDNLSLSFGCQDCQMIVRQVEVDSLLARALSHGMWAKRPSQAWLKLYLQRNLGLQWTGIFQLKMHCCFVVSCLFVCFSLFFLNNFRPVLFINFW